MWSKENDGKEKTEHKKRHFRVTCYHCGKKNKEKRNKKAENRKIRQPSPMFDQYGIWNQIKRIQKEIKMCKWC